MDERHWWIATKLQETFKAGALDGFYESFLEDFLADANTVDHINNFLSPGGHTKLFFYALKGGSVSRASANAGPQRIHVASSAVKLKEVLSEEAICVVFLRANINRDIEPGSVEREIFVLELKHNVLGSFSDLLSRAFLPFLKARSDWGETVSNEVNEFLYHMEKYSTTLQDYSEALNVPHQILKRPDMLVTNDFKQNRALAVNSAAVAAYEQLVQDWMQTIEGLLLETSEGR